MVKQLILSLANIRRMRRTHRSITLQVFGPRFFFEKLQKRHLTFLHKSN